MDIETMKSLMRTYELNYGIETYEQQCKAIEQRFREEGLLIGFDDNSDVLVYLDIAERVVYDG